MKLNARILSLTVTLCAALLAVSCAKVERFEVSEAPVQIDFSVVGSQQQTKHALPYTGAGLIQDGCVNFYCNAWYNPTAGATQRFMDTADVRPDQIPNPTVWAPTRNYFWPVTGSVNFFSYASARPLGAALTSVGASESTPGTVFTITDYEIQDSDNILIADAVYFATRNNAGSSTAVVDTNNVNHPLTGVPTVFHHLLAQVAMDLQLTTANPTANTDYEVTVDDIKLTGVRDRGSITLTNTPLGSYGSQCWTVTAPATPPTGWTTNVGWVPTGSTVTYTLTPDAANVLTLQHGATVSTERIVLRGGAVMPQTLGGISITLTITIRSKHGDTIYNTDENVVLSGPLNNDQPAWYMNQKILYHIGFDPVTTTLTFDPVINEWDPPVNGGNVQL